VAFEAAGELELEQHHAHNRGRGAREPDHIVDRGWAWAKQTDDARALAAAGLAGGRGGGFRLLDGDLVRAAENRTEHRDHVGRFGHERGALLEQLVAALGARIERGAGRRKDLTALLEGKPGSDEGARAFRRFDDDDAGSQA